MEREVLERLEEKTRRAVEALASLRAENTELSRELEQSREQDGGDRDPLEDQLRLLHDERQAIRKRVESLIDLLEEAL